MDKKTILVVDDDHTTVNILEDALGSFGYRCLTANDGIEALQLIKDETFSAAICDIRMPGMDGLEVMAAARKIAPELPFIVITGFSEEYVYDQVIEAGATDFIQKPIKISELTIKLRRVLEERLLIDKNTALLRKANAVN